MVTSIHDVDRPRLEGLYSLYVRFRLILVPFPWSDFGRGRQIDERLPNITSPRYLSRLSSMSDDWNHYEVSVVLLALCDAGPDAQHTWSMGTARFPSDPPHLSREAAQL